MIALGVVRALFGLLFDGIKNIGLLIGLGLIVSLVVLIVSLVVYVTYILSVALVSGLTYISRGPGYGVSSVQYVFPIGNYPSDMVVGGTVLTVIFLAFEFIAFMIVWDCRNEIRSSWSRRMKE